MDLTNGAVTVSDFGDGASGGDKASFDLGAVLRAN
jgi:hypothetical protein